MEKSAKSNLDDSGSDIFLFHDGRRVQRAVGKARRVIVDVFHLNNDGAASASGGACLAAASVVGDHHFQTVRDSALVHRTDQRYYSRRRRDAERAEVELVICDQNTSVVAFRQIDIYLLAYLL